MSKETMEVIIFALGLIAASLFLILYIPIFKKLFKKTKQTNKEQDTVEYALGVIQSEQENVTPEKKANAFITLIRMSYVLVHTMINEGNKYDDFLQSKHFKSSLTPDIMNKINALEDYHG